MTVAASNDTQELLRLAIGPACHELRSPLAVVYGFARMLEDAPDVDTSSSKYVSHIVKSAERLDVLLDDLAQLGRIAAGRAHAQLESVPLRPVIDDLKATQRNEQRLLVDAGADISVKADPAWLRTSLHHIVDGLCFEDGIDIRLSWRHERHEAQLHIVPNSSFPMIDVEPEKSGLGIALARMRIVAMGGAFEGSGDRIVVTLPRV